MFAHLSFGFDFSTSGAEECDVSVSEVQLVNVRVTISTPSWENDL